MSERTIPLEDPTGYHSQGLIQTIDIVQPLRLQDAQQSLSTRYVPDVGRLTTSEKLRRGFLTDLADYEKKWTWAPRPAQGTTRRERVLGLLQRHPFVYRDKSTLVVPLAVMMQVANSSSEGIYTQDTPAVAKLTEQTGAFMTLTALDYWRAGMAEQATLLGHRFRSQGTPMELVMVGDGNGELGRDMAQTLWKQGLCTRLIHIDVGEAALAAQRQQYMESGIPGNRIKSVRGSITDPTLLSRHISSKNGQYYVLHEIFDILPTHAMVSDPEDNKVKELYELLDLTGKTTRDPISFDSHSALLARLGTYLPFFQPHGIKERHIPFSPAVPLALRNMLQASNQAALYIGDYGAQFLLGDTQQQYRKLSLRLYGEQITAHNMYHYPIILDRAVDMTADVLPASVYFSRLFGGQVEQLSSQERYLSRVDAALPARMNQLLPRLRSQAQADTYRNNPTGLLRDTLIAGQLANPTMFAAVVTKGLK